MANEKCGRKILPYESIKAINRMFDTIPSTVERQELLESIDGLIEFLRGIRTRIENLPDDKELLPLVKATNTLSDFLEKAHTNPTLASIIGLSLRRARRKKEVYLSKEELASVVKEFESLPTAEMYKRLESYTRNQLLSIARQVDIQVSSRLSKADIVDKIVKIGFANIRGYRLLRSSNIRNQKAE